MIKLSNYSMRIYVRDRRCKSGERILASYLYRQKQDDWMQEEVRDLKSKLYADDKYRFEVDPIAGK